MLSKVRMQVQRVKGEEEQAMERADQVAAEKISARIAGLGDWRGETLGRVRELILAADPGVIEEWKWEKPTSSGVPVWSHDGIICTGETHSKVVKLTFARGVFVDDPQGLFNASLEGNLRRAIDIREGEMVNAKAFQELIRAAAASNAEAKAVRAAKKK